MKFTRSPTYKGGEVQIGEQVGIGAALLEKFGKTIPNVGKIHFNSVLQIDASNNTYQVNLEMYGIPNEDVAKFMKRFGCKTLEGKATT